MAFVAIGPSVYDGTQQYLRDDVASYLFALVRDYEAETGEKVYWGDALRTDAEQEAEFRLNYTSGWPKTGSVYWNGSYWRKRAGRPTTAVPGRSNHRLGTTIDFYITARFLAWLRKNAYKYGFTNTEGAAVGENWHWGFTRTPTITAPTAPAGGTSTELIDYREEPDMANAIELVQAGDQPGEDRAMIALYGGGVENGFVYIKPGDRKGYFDPWRKVEATQRNGGTEPKDLSPASLAKWVPLVQVDLATWRVIRSAYQVKKA